MIIPDSQAALGGKLLLSLKLSMLTIAECYRMLKPGGKFALSVWHKEHWSYEVRDALCQLPGHPNWPQSSEELTNTWAQGPWENVHYVRSMLHRRGFTDIQVETKSIMISLKDAEDFYEVYDAFIDWITDRYWTEEEKKNCKPLIKPSVVQYMETKYGKGKPFAIEKVCVLATAKRPETKTKEHPVSH
jgi:SAM-dependent methyltransferase